LNTKFAAEHKVANILHTLLILITMMALLALLGLVIAGIEGLFLALFFGVVLILFYPSIDPSTLAKLYGAKYLPEEQAPQLYNYLKELSSRAELKRLPSLFIIDTDIMAAFTMGNGSNAAIVISKGLINNLELPEIVSILAHETAHIINNDLWLMSLTDIISRITSIFSIIGQVMVLIYLPFYFFADVNIPWLGIAILLLAPLTNTLLQLTLSRIREYDADLTAAYLTGETENLAKALAKIEYSDRSFLESIFLPTKQEKIPSLFRTHPSTEERIKRLSSIHIPVDIKPIQFYEKQYTGIDDLDYQKMHALIRYLLGYWF